jgi:L-fuculose-phosphate aldolase
MSGDSIRAEILEIGRRLDAKGLITAAEGNLSVKDGDRIFITAGGAYKGRLTPEQVVVTDLEGRVVEGEARVSSELPMHLAIYRARPDVRAVVHAHPPVATAFAVAHVPLDRPILAEAVLLLGSVPVVPYAPPSTAELASAVASGVAQAQALLLANHGAVTLGESLARAHERMETLEHLARVTLFARLLGGDHPLAAEEVQKLLALPTAPYVARDKRS